MDSCFGYILLYSRDKCGGFFAIYGHLPPFGGSRTAIKNKIHLNENNAELNGRQLPLKQKNIRA
jgi:hypothetical protein